MSLVAITPDRYDVDISIAYATAGNFTGSPVYATAYCYLHADAAKLLQRAIEWKRSIKLFILNG